MTSVIRVKRKRDCEPAEALLLARKKLKNDDEQDTTRSDIADVIKIEEKVFHFAGTVESDIAHSQDVVAEKVKEAIFERRQQKAALMLSSRKRKLPKFVSNTCSQLPKIKHLKDATIAACQSVLREKCLNFTPDKSDTNIKKFPQQIAKKGSGFENCEKCTIYHNDDHIPKTDTTIDEIMCNNEKMLREKLTISSSKKTMQKSSGFVYDLYYCKDPSTNWDMGNLLYVQPYRYGEQDLLGASDSEDELYEDDDDSNDEDNWRNDYPDDDDDDSSGSSSTSDDDWERFVQQEEEDMENDDDDLDGANDDRDDALGNFGMDGQDQYDYNDDLDAEAAFDYDQNDCNNDANNDDFNP